MEPSLLIFAMSAATNLSPSPVLAEVPLPASSPHEPAEFRSRMGKISRQSGVYFAGTILTTGVGYFFRIYLARALGAEALGLYALGMSLVGLLSVFNALGLPTSAQRFIAEYAGTRDYPRLGAFLRGSLGLLAGGNLLLGALLIFAGPWIAVHFYHSPSLSKYLWAFALIMFFGVLNTFLGQAMAGYQGVTRRTFITHFVGTPANIVFAVILISMGFSLSGYLAAQVMSAFLVLSLLTMSLWNMTPVQARRVAGFSLSKEVKTFSAAAFVVALVEFVLGQADKIVLGHYLNAAQVGIYAVAMALVSFVPIALQSVNQIFTPNIAELHALGSHALLQKLYTTLTRWVVILTLPLAAGIIAFPNALMGIFGPAFQSGAYVLIIGTLGQLINCGVGSVGCLLLMSGQQLQIVKIQAVNAVLMLGLCLVLVPRFGIAGAAIAAATSVAVTNMWALASVYRRLGLFPYDRSFLKLLMPAAVTAAVLFVLRFAGRQFAASWPIAPVAVVLAYVSFLVALLMQGLEPDDRGLLQAVWNRVSLRFRNEEPQIP